MRGISRGIDVSEGLLSAGNAVLFLSPLAYGWYISTTSIFLITLGNVFTFSIFSRPRVPHSIPQQDWTNQTFGDRSPLQDGSEDEYQWTGGPASLSHLSGGFQGTPDAPVWTLLLQVLCGVPVMWPGQAVPMSCVPPGCWLQQLTAQRDTRPGHWGTASHGRVKPHSRVLPSPPQPPQSLLWAWPRGDLWAVWHHRCTPAAQDHTSLYCLQPHEGKGLEN